MPTNQKGLNGPALSHAQMDENFALVDTNEAAIATETTRATAEEASIRDDLGSLISAEEALRTVSDTALQDQIDEQQIVGELTFGENNVNDAFVPFVITDTVTGTLQDSFTTPNTNVDGDWEKIIYSNPISRYTSGGKLMLTLVNNTGVTPHYLTNEYTFSRIEGGDFIVSTPTTAGDATLLDSIKIAEVTVELVTSLEVTLIASNVAPQDTTHTRIVGQITYTSVPIFVTASGY
ncbi:hypothetical protein N9578_01465 [bacterium]|nr:hypothetical protein [bacterium]